MIRLSVLGFVLITGLLRVQDAPEPPDNDTSPLHVALLAYKSGKYDDARAAINAAEKANPGDPATEILKARILIELKDFPGAKTTLESLNGNTKMTPELFNSQIMALGDMCLRKRSFFEASKFYEALLGRLPGDPDVILKVIYARIGQSDLVAAGKFASQLKPIDPKNPLDPHASYYFAKAALAQATNNTQGAEDNIQTARTIYGNTIADRYLKTYLELFAPADKTPNSDLTPAPLVKPVPTGTTP